MIDCSMIFQVGKHGIIIEFTDPDYNTRRSATYLPEVAAHEGDILFFITIMWNSFINTSSPETNGRLFHQPFA